VIEVVAVAAVALGAIAQAASGIGFALVCGPLLIATQGPDDGVRLVVLLSAVVNVAILVREHRDVRYADGAVLLVPAVVAAPLLVPVVRRVDDATATVLAGVLTVAAALLLLAGLRARALHGRAGAALAGVVSATMNVLAGIGGPAAALYAANAGWSTAATRSTLQAYFLVLNVVTLAAFGLPPISPAALAALLVAIGAGYLVGMVATRRMGEVAARRTTLLLAAAGGVAAVVRGLS
jgi:uncharacterized membrane protein YfcA